MPPRRYGGPHYGRGHGCSMVIGLFATVPPFVRCAVYSEVWGPNYKNQGDSPRTSGGRDCLAAVSFLSFSGQPNWLWRGRPPVPGRCTGLRTAPARIRGGTQGIVKPKGCSFKLQHLG